MSEATVGQTFGEYVELVREAFGHANRHGPLLAYLQGLLLPGRGRLASPVDTEKLPASLLERLGGTSPEGLVAMLRLLLPISTAPWLDSPAG